MDEEDGLDLSLALPCGAGSTVLSKTKSGSSLDPRTDEGDRDSKWIDDFKSFLQGGNQRSESSQQNDLVKHEENFFNNLSKAVVDVDTSMNLNNKGFWNLNAERSTNAEEGKKPEALTKRKNMFDEMYHQKKRDREAHIIDLHEKTRASHISVTTDEGSAAENEDVADSEADASNSRLVSQRDVSSRHYIGGVGVSDVPKDVHAVSDSFKVDLQAQKQYPVTLDKSFKHGNMLYGVPFPHQAADFMNLHFSPPMKESNLSPNIANYAIPGVMPVVTAPNSERPGTQPIMHVNMHLIFGDSSVQLPTLDKENSCGLLPCSPQLQSSHISRVPSFSDNQTDGLNISRAAPIIPRKPSETMQHHGKVSEQAKSDGKYALEEGACSRMEDDVKGSSLIFGVKDASDRARAECFPAEYLAIRPGIASDLNFGGSGAYPNLPWVSTTAPGPNGRTISGVTYRYNATQIRIVCACHGSHMSPEDFIQHAGKEQVNLDADAALASFSSNNPTASAQR